MNVAILISFTLEQTIKDMLAAGTVVALRRDVNNEKDPGAVQAFLGEVPVGYLANSANTVPKNHSPAARIANHLAKSKVAGAFAKLVSAGEIQVAKGNTMTYWTAAVYWLPVWDANGGDKDGDDAIEMTVGGSRVSHGSITEVKQNITKYTSGGLIAKMFDSGSKGSIPTVWIADSMNARGASPAGEILNPTPEFLTALSNRGELPVCAVKNIDNGSYAISVALESNDMSDYYDEMTAVISNCIMQSNDITERVDYMLSQAVPKSIIHGVLQTMRACPDECAVIKPSQLFLQSAQENYLTRSIGYHLAGKNIRLVGEKGAGKNTLVATVCWLMNQPLCRIQGNSDMDKIDLLGGQALDDHGTHFELSSFVQMLQRGGDVVLDEINSVKPEIAIILHSVADDARSIEIPGYGRVEVHPSARLWATMNEAYIGTGEMNEATADRFVPIYMEDKLNIEELLTQMVPNAPKSDIKACATIYDKVRKAVKEGRVSVSAMTTRGYIDALQASAWLPMRACLLDNVAGRPQDPAEREVIENFIRGVYPA